MLFSLVKAIAYYIGMALLIGGGILDLMASIGLSRFKSFCLRLHVATVGAIGGTLYPLIGLGLLSLSIDQLGISRYYIAGIAFTTALFLAITAPSGAHALAQSTYKSRTVLPEPIITDQIMEEGERGVNG